MEHKWKQLISILLIIAGNAIVALGVCAFVLPNGLIMGGVTGLALIGNHFWNLSITIITYGFNIFFFIVGWIFKGKKFALSIVISTVSFPSFLWLFQSIPGIQYTGDDLILSTVFAGILIGAGGGLILKNGGSSGGIEVMHILIHDKTGLPLAGIINTADIIILGVQAIFSSVEQILYGILLTFILAFVLNKVLVFGESKIQVTVISPQYTAIRDMMTLKMDLGCTFLDISTGFSMTEQKAVLCVLSRRRLSELHSEILAIDPKAFIITAQVNNVKGRGFSLPKINKSL